MNNTVISLLSADDGIKRANVFGVDEHQPTLYMPQYITMQGITNKDCSEFQTSIFEIRDHYITAINKLVLNIDLPEVKGMGKFGYIPYVGYKLIKHVTITSDHGTLWEISGEELFDMCSNNQSALELSGYSRELNDISTGMTQNDTVKEATSVYVYIQTPFDVENTFSSLKLHNSKITVMITFNSIADVVVYDSIFDIDTFVKNFVYVTELTFVGYMVRNIQTKTSFIEITRKNIGQINQTTSVITDVHASTALRIYVKPCYGNTDNRFISYPGFLQSERDYINSFVERLLEDLVTVSVSVPTKFPDTAEIVDVTETGIVTIQDADVVVKIDNVPEDHNVYYHTNILIFGTRKNAVIYNLSKKFYVITGTYSESTNRIIFTNVSHNITIADASIPVSVWSCQRNVYNGDNRSDASKYKDLYVNDPFIKGIDFKNKIDVISRMEVRFGNDVLYTETTPVSKIYGELLKQVKGIRTLLFNFTPQTFFRPTTLNSNPSRGKDKLMVRVVFSALDVNNPIYYVSKQLVVICSELYKIIYDGGVRAIKVNKDSQDCQ
ncbi:Trimeric virion coat protein [Sea otter poxvirus]|uniref:62 kDa protein n=1 Tax=Sea otter poxvirus TaxID=1416741 RepID=A0A2U9QHR3_9POXV|nr:Trimeric virion coat protein [Sea otter poxvirus]AWU47133.1 Trimeric virion coat protein [Sea otter poxvirus]